MRINQPVTNTEVELNDGQTIVSRTNLKGVITYVSRDFLEISGFSEQELIKKNHNIVRHPDMPPEAFQNLWDTVHAGHPWTGIVKNRCKNGDFYWVEAHVTPTFENGRMTGHLSVRRKPTRKQIKDAEQLYAAIKCGDISLEAKAGLPLIRHWQTLSLSGKLLVQVTALLVLAAGVAAAGFLPGNTNIVRGMILAASVGLSFNLWRWFGKSVTQPLKTAQTRLEEIAEGNFTGSIDIHDTGELGQLQRRLKSVQIKLGFDIDDARQHAEDAGRLKQALDNVNTNVMMCDNDFNIMYVNDAARQMFGDNETELCKALPAFNAAEMLGSSIDIFHKNPSHQRQMLAALTGEHKAEIKIAGHSFTIVANPVSGPDGERLGTVMEWDDRTQIVAVEDDVAQVVEAARNGDMDKRIVLDGKEGFFRSLSAGVNSLVATAQEVNADSSRVLGALAQGQLTESIDRDYQGAFAQLKRDANSSVERLIDIVSQIQAASESVKTGANEIAEGNADLSQRTEEQASGLEQTSSNMAEMTSTVRENAESATRANQLSTDVKEQAQQGGEVVNEAIGAMGEINESSKKIADIIGTIDEIAFQTNLLALNASVEAARAGEQGRGFAVVASEVRNLAGRSADAAKEIKELIEDSVIRVENGAQLVNKSGEVLNQIIEGITQTSDLVNEIAAANARQSSGIDEVNESITQMDSMTQQNAALVEQAAAASESLGEQARGLNELMHFFKLPEGSGAGQSDSGVSVPAEERRTQTRPWSDSPDSTTTHDSPAATGTDNDWNEF